MHRYDRQRRVLAYGMATLAGFIDATGFFVAGGYFVSFMSGNSTRLGVNLASYIPAALTPALLIFGFVAGVVLGALVAERWSARRKTAVLALACGLIALAALGSMLDIKPMYLAGSVLAMGAINNAFGRSGEPAVGVTYMTGALVRLGQGIAARLRGAAFEGVLASFTLWISLAAGAVAGALATLRQPDAAPWLSLGWALLLLLFAARIERQGR